MIKLIRYCFYLLFFATPLIFTSWTFELFEFNKMMFVYLMTIIITSAWAAEMLMTRIILVKRTPLDIPILLFFISQCLSTIYSINIHTSLIGYYSRFHGGLLSTISYILLYYAFITLGSMNNEQETINNKQKNHSKNSPKPYTSSSLRLSEPNGLLAIRSPFVRTCLHLLLTSATLIATYAILQHFGIDKSKWVQDVQRRVFSTLGQPNWLAAFLIMVLPLTWSLLVSQPSKIYYLLSVILYTALLYTKSRSGLIGFGISFILFWSLALLKDKFPGRKFLALSLMLLALSYFDGLSWFTPLNSLRQKLSSITLITSITQSPVNQAPTGALAVPEYRGEGGTESGDIRKIVWKGSIGIWKHYPLFGSGVETFAYSYYNFRPVDHNLVSEWDFLYNKAHNEYLNFLATTGAFGLGTYVLLQLSVFLFLIKQIFSSSKLSIIHYPLSISLLSGLAGVSISNFFGFSTVPIGLLMFLYPAIAVALSQKPITKKLDARRYSLDATRKILLFLVLLASGYTLLALGKWYYADTQFALGKRYAEAGYLPEAFPKLRTAVKLVPSEPMFRNELAQTSADIAIAFMNQDATDSAEQAVRLALEEANTVQAQNPLHVNFLKSRARIMLTLAQLNPIFLEEAENTFKTGLELSPTDAKLMYNLALIYKNQGKTDQHETTLLKTIASKSNYIDARFDLGQLYEVQAASSSGILKKDYLQKAQEQYQYILKHLDPQNQKIKQILDRISPSLQ